MTAWNEWLGMALIMFGSWLMGWRMRGRFVESWFRQQVDAFLTYDPLVDRYKLKDLQGRIRQKLARS